MLIPWMALFLALQAAPPVSLEEALHRAVQANPAAFEPNYQLGQYYVRQGKLADAIRYLAASVRANPDHTHATHDLGLAFLETGHPAKACDLLESALTRREEPAWLNLRGACMARLDEPLEAARALHRAAELDPSEPHLFVLGDHLLRFNSPVEAVKIFAYAVGLHPRSPRLRVGLGIAYYSSGYYDEAVSALCAAVDLDPGDGRALDFLGKLHDVSPNLADQVTRRLAGFVERYPRNARAHYYYALSLWKRQQGGGALDSAVTHLREALRLDPRFAEAHLQLGILLDDRGRSAEAIAALADAVRLDPRLRKAHFRLMRLYARTGEPERARQHQAAFEELAGGPVIE
jgi:tetratricopeptide (TPR) repeat protein